MLPRLDLRTTGMEFASEMVIRASKENLAIAEFPIEYHPRGGESKLSSFRDGWRHLRFLLVHSPNHLFIVPGAALAGLGTLIVVLVGAGLDFFGRAWGLHALIGGALLMIVGTQVLALGLCAHAYGTYFMGEQDPWFDRMRARFRLEHGLLLGGAFVLVGVLMGVGDPRDVDLPRLRLARRRTPGGDRRVAVDRRHPDLLLLVPAEHPRSAPRLRHPLSVTSRRVAAIGVLVIVAFLTALLLQRGWRRSGTDMTPNREFVAFLSGGQQACQDGEVLPGDTAALQMTIGTSGEPGPPLRATITARDGATLASGRLAAGWRQGAVRIPVTHASATTATTEDVRVCLRDDDPLQGGRAIELAGETPDLGYETEVAGQMRENLRLRVDYLRPGRESWLQLLPTIANRFSLGKSDLLRHWAWIAVLLLMAGGAALAVWTILSETAPLEDGSAR